jgi:hypothetical protein
MYYLVLFILLFHNFPQTSCVKHAILFEIHNNEFLELAMRCRDRRLFFQRQMMVQYYAIESFKQKRKLFKYRNSKKRPKWKSSPWYRMLSDPLVQDPTTREGELFRRRFRIPFPIFQRIVDVVREQGWYPPESYKSGKSLSDVCAHC